MDQFGRYEEEQVGPCGVLSLLAQEGHKFIKTMAKLMFY